MHTAAIHEDRLVRSFTASLGSTKLLLLLVLRKVRQTLRAGCAAHLFLPDDKRLIFFKQSSVKENGSGAHERCFALPSPGRETRRTIYRGLAVTHSFSFDVEHGYARADGISIPDTHALLWYLINLPALGVNARLAFDEADAGQALIYIPASS